MRALVLAAGIGQRMRPLTLLRAKPVLPVLNRPLLHWTLELLARHGVTEVVINLHHLPGTIRDAVGDGRAFGLRVLYSRERTILGTGGALRKVRDFFAAAPFFVVNGDMVFDFDLRALMGRHHSSGALATLALRPNPDPKRYAPVITSRRGWVLSLPGLPPRRGRVSLFAGVHILDPVLLKELPTGASDSVRHLYAPAIARGGRVLGARVKGRWYDLSDAAMYLESHRSLLRSGLFGRARLGRLVAKDAKVHERARVEESVVGHRARVEAGAVVRRSVLWDGVVVGAGAVVRDSILAYGVRVAPKRRVLHRVGVDLRGVGDRKRGVLWVKAG